MPGHSRTPSQQKWKMVYYINIVFFIVFFFFLVLVLDFLSNMDLFRNDIFLLLKSFDCFAKKNNF